MLDRVGPLVLASLAPAVLLAVDPWGWYPFGPIKWLLVLTAAPLGCGATLLVRRARVPRRLHWALLAFLGWMALTTLIGEDRWYGWIGTPERHLGLVTWVFCAVLLMAGSALDERGARTVARGLVVAGLGVGAVATTEALGWEPSVLDVSSRLSGSVGSPAYLGAAAALLLPPALGAALGRIRPIASGTAVGLLAVALIGSGARAAWLGLAVAAGVALLASARAARAWVREQPMRALGAVSGALLVLVVVVLVTPVGGRLADATDADQAGGRGRLDEWRVATRVVADHPGEGVGPEGYRVAFHEGVDERYEREHGRRQQPDRAHSVLLDIALTGGLPLLGAWLVIVAIVGRSCWRALATGPAWLRGVAAGLVAHVVGQLLLFPIVELEPIAWLLAGIVVAHDRPPREPKEPMRDDPKLVGAVLASTLLFLLLGAADVDADHWAKRSVDATARGDTRAAAEAADQAAGRGPLVVRLQLLAARAEIADQQGIQAGLERVDDALDVSPGDPIVRLARLTYLVQRAEATQTGAHRAEAREALDAELRDDPVHAALWRLRARLAAVDGDPGLTTAAAARADELTPPDDAR